MNILKIGKHAFIENVLGTNANEPQRLFLIQDVIYSVI